MFFFANLCKMGFLFQGQPSYILRITFYHFQQLLAHLIWITPHKTLLSALWRGEDWRRGQAFNLHLLTSSHMLTWRSGIQNLKSKICIRSHPHTYAHLPTDLILESKIQRFISLDPYTCSPNQISEIQNPRSKIFISSHPHLPKDLEYKI